MTNQSETKYKVTGLVEPLPATDNQIVKQNYHPNQDIDTNHVERKADKKNAVLPAIRIVIIIGCLILSLIIHLHYGYMSRVFTLTNTIARIYRGAANWDVITYYELPLQTNSPKDYCFNNTNYYFVLPAAPANPNCVQYPKPFQLADMKPGKTYCAFMSGKGNQNIHDTCMSYNSGAITVVNYLYQCIVDMASSSYGISRTTTFKVVRTLTKLDGTSFTSMPNRVLYNSDLFLHNQLIASEQGLKIHNQAYYNEQPFTADYCKPGDKRNICNAYKAYVAKVEYTGPESMIPIGTVNDQDVIIAPYYDTNGKFSFITTSELWFDNFGADGFIKTSESIPNPSYHSSTSVSVGSFRYGIYAQVIIIELLVIVQAVFGHGLVTSESWFFTTSSISSPTLYVVQMLIMYLGWEMYYFVNNVMNAKAGSSWVSAGIAVVQAIEMVYVLFCTAPVFSQMAFDNYIPEMNLLGGWKLRGNNILIFQGISSSIVLLILGLAWDSYQAPLVVLKQARTGACGNGYVQCGSRYFSSLHIAVAFSAGISMIVASKKTLETRNFSQKMIQRKTGTSNGISSLKADMRDNNNAPSDVSNFEHHCLGMPLRTLGATTQFDLTYDGKPATSAMALGVTGFSLYKNAIVRTKDLIYLHALDWVSFLQPELNLSVVAWPVSVSKIDDTTLVLHVSHAHRLYDVRQIDLKPLVVPENMKKLILD